MKFSFVYILASGRNGTIYTGVTTDMLGRVQQHKSKNVKGFTSRYDVSLLVYFETFNDISEAIRREKQIKKYNRQWKLRLIEQENPEWMDLYPELMRAAEFRPDSDE